MLWPALMRSFQKPIRLGEQPTEDEQLDVIDDPESPEDLELSDVPDGSDEGLANLLGATTTPRLRPMNVDDISELDEPQPTRSLQRYMDVAAQRPDRADYRPSFGQKLVAGLAGALQGYRDPAAGVKLTQGMLDKGYDTAHADWEDKLNTAKTTAALDVDTQKPGIERAKLVQAARTKVLDLQARMAAVKQREEDSKRDYDAALANAANAEERNRITSEHNKAMEAISKERNGIAAEAVQVQNRLAAARELGASAYAFGQFLKPLDLAGRYKGRPPTATERIRARQEAVRRVIAQHPEWEDFMSGDEKNPQFGPYDSWGPGVTAVPPELEQAVKEAEEAILGGR